MTIVFAAVFQDWRWLFGTLLALAAFVFVNQRLLGWFARVRGSWFAVRAAVIHLVYHATNVAALGYSIMSHFIRLRRRDNRASKVA